ncbi:enoyl-CoA hydratase [Ureibacillus massiliensis 4400831 = CIP 108448 = CCUG 49529]|uniref:Enoyl-CoA hydratase n=1 Tax=Ureibacillus massiliensis 4400831 = CIP 108448 = CCUG 49529 TaxID=1211035 RepID=A0A0A3J6T0_9BACL|nr:MaoC/PaaZ C-terminal domain-containing protein [Ureibacillus massiliensis]KGR91435.1 enoyl-CoA hydratase [Ureibacillus massiliensis 4400831 = CIP 108448 = CCUG 49529]
MLIRKGIKLGKKVEEISIGEKLYLTEKIEDKDLLLYLGLTNDSNPLYIQHDYAAETAYQKPIVPTIMLNGIITSAISKHIPGPGSRIIEQNMRFIEPVYHYETINIILEVDSVNISENIIYIHVNATNESNKPVIEGIVIVMPPL